MYVGKGQDNMDDEVSHIVELLESWAEGFEQYALAIRHHVDC